MDFAGSQSLAVSTYDRGERDPFGIELQELNTSVIQKNIHDLLESDIHDAEREKNNTEKINHELTCLQSLADDLVSVIQNCQIRSYEIHRIYTILPDLLRQFASKLVLEVTSSQVRNIIHDIYLNPRYV